MLGINELEKADGKMRECIDSNIHDISGLKEYKDQLIGFSRLNDIWKDIKEYTAKLID